MSVLFSYVIMVFVIICKGVIIVFVWLVGWDSIVILVSEYYNNIYLLWYLNNDDLYLSCYYYLDINECLNVGICNYGICENIDGLFYCKCLFGWSGLWCD